MILCVAETFQCLGDAWGWTRKEEANEKQFIWAPMSFHLCTKNMDGKNLAGISDSWGITPSQLSPAHQELDWELLGTPRPLSPRGPLTGAWISEKGWAAELRALQWRGMMWLGNPDMSSKASSGLPDQPDKCFSFTRLLPCGFLN